MGLLNLGILTADQHFKNLNLVNEMGEMLLQCIGTSNCLSSHHKEQFKNLTVLSIISQ